MGAGKSTVGRLLSERLGYPFFDSDLEIQASTGVTIPVIFDIEGEAGFRAREQAMIDKLTKYPNIILATGGGAVLNLANRNALGSRGFVIYLRSNLESLVQRTKNDQNRPLLQTDNPEEVLRKLLEERDPIYTELADLIVDTQQSSVHKLVNSIQDQLRTQGVI